MNRVYATASLLIAINALSALTSKYILPTRNYVVALVVDVETHVHVLLYLSMTSVLLRTATDI